jgi:uncharacterized protein (TIGR02246 family)
MATTTITSEEEAVRDLFGRLLDAWGRGDGHAYGALFTEDADYVAFDGSHTKGRRAIAESHQKLFDSWLKGTRLLGKITALRFLGPDIALVHATGETLMPGKDKPVRPSIQTLVAVNREGTWLFTAFHNTRIVRRNALQWVLFGIKSKVFDR